jgi:transposase-like protein
MKHYVSQTILKMIDGRLDFKEVVLTRADSRCDAAGCSEANVRRMAQKMRAIGIENLHVNKYEKKRYNKLIREQNKRHKERKLTASDLAKMTAQAEELESKNV